MASLRKRNGTFHLDFTAPNGRRRNLTLGTKSGKKAADIQGKIETLLTSIKYGVSLDSTVAAWLTGISNELRMKLTEYGLLGERQQELLDLMKLDGFLQRYIDGRPDVKRGTLVAWSFTRRNLIDHFGADKLLSEITAGDAAAFERYLKRGARVHRSPDAEKADSLSAATIRKRCQHAKQFFAAAVDHELIDKNPFAKLKSAAKTNRQRDFFVTMDMYADLIDACPDVEWRLIIALSRIGGVRCPSEIIPLRWTDIDWERGRMTIHSPKTEHHQGRASRIVPLFPELRKELDEAFFSPSSPEFVVTRYRDTSQNLRTQFTKIIRRAGLTPWPKLFQNMRASRATELSDQFPSHVAAMWLGHTEKIADDHYRQTTEQHFEKAATLNSAPQFCHSTPLQGAVLSPPDPENTLIFQGSEGNQLPSMDSNHN